MIRPCLMADDALMVAHARAVAKLKGIGNCSPLRKLHADERGNESAIRVRPRLSASNPEANVSDPTPNYTTYTVSVGAGARGLVSRRRSHHPASSSGSHTGAQTSATIAMLARAWPKLIRPRSAPRATLIGCQPSSATRGVIGSGVR